MILSIKNILTPTILNLSHNLWAIKTGSPNPSPFYSITHLLKFPVISRSWEYNVNIRTFPRLVHHLVYFLTFSSYSLLIRLWVAIPHRSCSLVFRFFPSTVHRDSSKYGSFQSAALAPWGWGQQICLFTFFQEISMYNKVWEMLFYTTLVAVPITRY